MEKDYTIVNDVSLVEKEKVEEAPKEEVKVEEAPITPDVKIGGDVSTPEAPITETAPAVETPVAIPVPEISLPLADPVSENVDANNNPIFGDMASLAMPAVVPNNMGAESAMQNDYVIPNFPVDNSNIATNQENIADGNYEFNGDNISEIGASNPNAIVYKTIDDVNNSKDKFIREMEASYKTHIETPTKTLVEIVNGFVSWGLDVTNNGLTRNRFEEFDELVKKYNGYKTALEAEKEESNILTFDNIKSLDSTSFEPNNIVPFGSDSTPSYSDSNDFGGMNLAA